MSESNILKLKYLPHLTSKLKPNSSSSGFGKDDYYLPPLTSKAVEKNFLIQNHHDQTNSYENKKRSKFKKIANIICMCYRWCQSATKHYKINIHRYISFAHVGRTKLLDDYHLDFMRNLNIQKRQAQMSALETQANNELVQNARIRAEMMNFNVDYFKSKKRLNTRLTNENVRNILSITNVNKRTRKDVLLVEKAIKSIQHMKFLHNLHGKMRSSFLETCWLEEYEPKRILIKQIRKSDFFYLLVQGFLVCTYKTDYEAKSKTICFLEDGMCFGELSLLDDSVNTVSVITRDDSQLLVIGKQDFFFIFLSNIPPNVKDEEITSKQVDDSSNEIFNFLKNIDFLKSRWPLDSLSEQEKCKIKYYHIAKGKTITESTKSSKYIYIVKSGSITVWLKPFVNTENQSDVFVKAQSTKEFKQLSYFPENKPLEHHHKEVLLKHIDDIVNDNNEDSNGEFSDMLQCFNSLKDTTRNESDHEEFNDDEITTQRFIVPVSAKKNTKFKSKQSSSLDANFKLPELVPHGDRVKSKKNVTIIKKIKNKNNQYKPGEVKMGETRRFKELKTKNKFNDEKHRLGDDEARCTENSEKQTDRFKVKKLFEGDYCGLNDLLFDSQPTMQLISNECECILFPKDIFMQYSNIQFLNDLRNVEKSYPDFEYIQFALKNHSEWKNFKRRILNISTANKALKF